MHILLKALEEEALAKGIHDLRIDTYQANIGMQKVIEPVVINIVGKLFSLFHTVNDWPIRN